MRALRQRAAASFVIAALSLPLWGGQDWVDIKATRVAEPGAFQTSLGLYYSVQDVWALGDRYVYLVEANGDYKLQRLTDLEWDLGWQLNPAWGLKLSVPYNFSEVSDYPLDGVIPYYRLNDATLRRADGLGDVSLELRRAWGPEPGHDGWARGLWLGLTAPTGLGPFEAPHTLAATGEGRWQGQGGFVVGWTRGSFNLIVQGSARAQLGRDADVSTMADLGYGANGPNVPQTGGPEWLGPRFGGDEALALGWDWYVEGDTRQTIGLELRGSQLSALDQGGALTPDTQASSLGILPQLQASFGAFHVLAAWEAPILYGNNVAASYDGGSHLRVDYGF
jgi:hypothetical protein